jgi:uncharacterized protein involved in tolerance to divalent cations
MTDEMVKIDKIVEIAEMLDSQGKKVTYDSVREVLGGCSYSIIGKGIQKWKAMKNATSQQSPAPDELINRMNNYLIPEIWRIAIQAAENRFAGERIMSEREISRFEENLKVCSEAADKAISEKDSATERVKELEALLVEKKEDLDTARKRTSDLENRCETLESRDSEMRLEIERRDKRISELYDKLSAARSETPMITVRELKQVKDAVAAKKSGITVQKKSVN